MGCCLGGWLAYEVAAAGQPDACVSYYGSGVPGRLDAAEHITCPVLFHFGGSDPFIPREQVEACRAALGDRPGVEFLVQEQAGHAFENHLAPQFHDAEAASRSWPATVDFLQRTLGS
jgi:carboxymethylenebutenolidase